MADWSWLENETVPLFVYDPAVVRANAAALRKAFAVLNPGSFKLFYSIKANPNPRLAKAIAGAVDGFDVSSARELEMLLRAGIKGSAITLSGPAKSEALLTRAFECGMAAVHLDSAEEFAIAKKLPAGATKITLRLAVGGAANPKLGFSLAHAESLARVAPQGFFSGIHFYGGRETFDPGKFQNYLSEALALRAKYPAMFNNSFEIFAGPGVPSMTVAKLGEMVVALKPSCTLNIEAGRGLVASAGKYAARVAAVKENPAGRRSVIIEGGTQHLGGSLLSPSYGTAGLSVECFRPGGNCAEASKPSTVFGSLCLGHDAVHPDATLPADLAKGDWLIFHPCGAYGVTASANQFIGQDLPREYLLESSSRKDISGTFFSYHESFAP